MSDENNQSEITGKKIFFLYPTKSLQDQVIAELIQQEYEVYLAKDHVQLSYALKKYPDSVVFVNVDDRISKPDWEKWINGLLTALPTIKIGVFSSISGEELKAEHFSMVQIACGYIPLKLDMSHTVDKIVKILEAINVKGRRKYLRANTETETTATLNMPGGSGFINASIKDISVVGVSCAFDNDPEFKKNSLNKDIQIKLQSMLVKVDAIVFGFRENLGQKIYVLLFTQRIAPDVKVKIRKYIQQNLQSKMDKEIH
ncbi:MAG: pilus assembly protein PilZ [Treponema sp.]|jgi:hypothetical protein|nr:pilus assembly protein PilZ [Treponema sp.]